MSSSPSVRLLVRRFSRKDSQVHRRNTFRSTNSIYEECNGKGVTPRTFGSPGGIEVPFTLTTWSARNRGNSHSRDSCSSISVSFDSDDNDSVMMVTPRPSACLSSVSTTLESSACLSQPLYSPFGESCQSDYSTFSSTKCESMSYFEPCTVTNMGSSYDKLQVVRVTSFVAKAPFSSSPSYRRIRASSSNSGSYGYSSLPL